MRIKRRDTQKCEWVKTNGLIPYSEALTTMETRVEAIEKGQMGELFWLLEHPALYTAGTSAQKSELLEPNRLPVYETGRGGHYTYHGPGQRVVYVMSDLRERGKDIHAHINRLESWIIAALAELDVKAEKKADRIGVWVTSPNGKEAKIAAIGVRVRRWITYHGFALNVSPDLSAFKGIIPCGLSEYEATSLEKLGVTLKMEEVDLCLQKTRDQFFDF